MNACCMVLVLRSRRRGPWRERERWQQEADEIVSLVSPWRKEEREKLRGPSSWHRTGGGAPNATMEVLESFPTETEERCPPLSPHFLETEDRVRTKRTYVHSQCCMAGSASSDRSQLDHSSLPGGLSFPSLPSPAYACTCLISFMYSLAGIIVRMYIVNHSVP
jgi:hypothetical protein